MCFFPSGVVVVVVLVGHRTFDSRPASRNESPTNTNTSRLTRGVLVRVYVCVPVCRCVQFVLFVFVVLLLSRLISSRAAPTAVQPVPVAVEKKETKQRETNKEIQKQPHTRV